MLFRSRLSDSTTTMPMWMAQLDVVGRGQEIAIAKSVGSSVLQGAITHLHNHGSAVRIRRYVCKAIGRIAGPQIGILPTVIKFEDASGPCALGFEYEADGIEFTVAEFPNRSMNEAEKLDYVHEFFLDTDELPDEVSFFDREKLFRLCEVVALRIRLEYEDYFNSESDLDSLVAEVTAAVESREVGDLVDEDEQLMRGIDDLMQIDDVRRCFVRMLELLLGTTEPDTSTWLQRRFASTVSAAITESAIRLSPEVDGRDLQIDISTDGRQIWLTELSPGGNGHLEALAEDLHQQADVLGMIIRSQSNSGELENHGRELEELVRCFQRDTKLRDLCAQIINSWGKGHDHISQLIEQLRLSTENIGLLITPSLMNALMSRFLGPGSSLTGLDISVEFMDFENRLPAIVGFVPEYQSVVRLAVEHLGTHIQRIAPHASTEQEIRREIELHSWPPNRNAARHDLKPEGQFERLPLCDRNLLIEALGKGVESLELAEIKSSDWTNTLVQHGEIEITAPFGDAHALRKFIVEAQGMPIEVNGL